MWDLFVILRLDGLDPLLSWGMGAHSGHVTVALWINDTLFILPIRMQCLYWKQNIIYYRSPLWCVWKWLAFLLRIERLFETKQLTKVWIELLLFLFYLYHIIRSYHNNFIIVTMLYYKSVLFIYVYFLISILIFSINIIMNI